MRSLKRTENIPIINIYPLTPVITPQVKAIYNIVSFRFKQTKIALIKAKSRYWFISKPPTSLINRSIEVNKTVIIILLLFAIWHTFTKCYIDNSFQIKTSVIIVYHKYFSVFPNSYLWAFASNITPISSVASKE